MYDVIIVGAGPAGSTLARLVGDRFKILVIDRRHLTDSSKGLFEKCCGGLIAPDAQQMLARMRLGVPSEVLIGPQLFTVRTIDVQNSIERYYQRHYINVDREKFDAWLISLIPTGVEVRCGCIYKSFCEAEDSVEVRFSYKGTEYREKTRILVGADGAYSRIRRQLAPESRIREYVAVQEWFQVSEIQPYYSAIFDPDVTDFYSWTIPKEELLLVGTAIPSNYNTHERFQALKNKLGRYGFALGKSIKKNGAFILRPVAPEQVVTGKGMIVLIGEAAGWISPTSAEGLSYAFRSAIALAESLGQDRKALDRNYQRNSNGLRRNILLKNLKVPFMYNSVLRKSVMALGIMSMNMYEK